MKMPSNCTTLSPKSLPHVVEESKASKFILSAFNRKTRLLFFFFFFLVLASEKL